MASGLNAAALTTASTRRLVDSHVHLWDRDLVPQTWIDQTMTAIDRDFLARDYEDALSDCAPQIGSGIVVQAEHSLTESAFLLDQASSPAVTGVIGWVDVTGDVDAQLDVLRAHPNGAALVGIRHLAHIDADESWLGRDDVAAGIQRLADAGLTFDLVVRPWQLRVAAEAAGRVPEARFVLDHVGKPPISGGSLAAWSNDLATLAKHPNVVAKLSGITIEADWQDWSATDTAPVFERALELFGPSRLMFGSDWPLVRLTRGGLRAWVDEYGAQTAALSPDEQASIDCGTAERVYGVGVTEEQAR